MIIVTPDSISSLYRLCVIRRGIRRGIGANLCGYASIIRMKLDCN